MLFCLNCIKVFCDFQFILGGISQYDHMIKWFNVSGNRLKKTGFKYSVVMLKLMWSFNTNAGYNLDTVKHDDVVNTYDMEMKWTWGWDIYEHGMNMDMGYTRAWDKHGHRINTGMG